MLRHSHVVLSPGPGRPDDPADFAVGREVLLAGDPAGARGLPRACRAWSRRTAAASSGSCPATGWSRPVHHDGAGLFAGLPQDFDAVRYHSLAAVELPTCLRVTATDAAQRADRWASRTPTLPLEGVQFHPESVLSEHGAALVANFLGGHW